MAFTCPLCRRTSYHPEDLAYRYCGACHIFTDAHLGTGEFGLRVIVNPGMPPSEVRFLGPDGAIVGRIVGIDTQRK